MGRIKALIMDVDGTLTDGGLYIGGSGEVMKRFDVKDGYGIHQLLPKHGITPIIITGRVSDIVEYRCKELGVTELIQGSRDKVKDMMQVLDRLGVSTEETAYIGDDIPDLACMKLVGVCGCPADAVEEVKKASDYICPSAGGKGAVREFIEWLLQEENEA